jgi:hypothetical protein
VCGVEERLRSESLIPRTVGRNTFSSDAPLKTITELMESCSGIVVIALERYFFPSGLEKRGGPKESQLAEIKLPTAWNQIEAAMAYSRGLPLLVIVEHGIKSEGLLERGNDWYVQWVNPDVSALSTSEFNGVFASWKDKVLTKSSKVKQAVNPAELTVAELVSNLKPGQLWGVLLAMSAIVAGSFTLGGRLIGTEKVPSNLQSPPAPSATP